MRPAFTSYKSAGAFALLLALILLLPVLLCTAHLPRRQVYATAGWNAGAFPWIIQKIFDETNDADIVFAGSAHIWCDVNAKYVQDELGREIKRDARVFTLGWNTAGYDALYVVAHDLLDHRRVHMLVIYDEGLDMREPQTRAHVWFRLKDDGDSLAGLSSVRQAGLYGSAVFSAPRDLLSLMRPNRLGDDEWFRSHVISAHHALDLKERNGALAQRYAWGVKDDFSDFAPKTTVRNSDALVYSERTSGGFAFRGQSLSPYKLHFLHKLSALCDGKGTKLVYLHTPMLHEMNDAVVQENECWPKTVNSSVALVGIPGAKLWAGMTKDEVRKLYLDDGHLNKNGQDVFTPVITQALIELYADSAGHS